MGRTCCINFCRSKYPDKENGNRRTLLQLPLNDEETRTKMLDHIGDHLNKNKAVSKILYICDLHFDESCFNKEAVTCMKDGKIVRAERQRLNLKKNAVPTIFPDEETRTKMLDHIGDHLNKNKADSKRLLNCDLHFGESCFNKEPVTCMEDGKIVTTERQRLNLKKNAVPTIFPDEETGTKMLDHIGDHLHVDESCFNKERVTCMQDGKIVTTERQRLNLKKNAVPTIFPIEQVPAPAKYMNMNSVCRVCLTEQTLLISMYEVHLTHNLNPEGTIESVPLSAVLQKYCNVTIDVSDKKPQKICVSCTNAVHKAYNFFELFLQSNATLEKMIQSQNVELPHSNKRVLPKKPTKKYNTLNVSPGSNKIVVQKNRKKTVNSSSVAHAKSITVNDVNKNGEYNIIIDVRNVSREVNASKTIDLVKIEEASQNLDKEVAREVNAFKTIDPVKREEGSQNLDNEVASIIDSALQNYEIIDNNVVKKEKKPYRIKTPPYFLNDPTGSLMDHSYLMSEKYFKDLQRRRVRRRKIKLPKPEKPPKKLVDYRKRQKQLTENPPKKLVDHRTRQKQLNQQMFDTDIFKCRFCKITLNGIDNVLQHVKDQHAGSKRCILCPGIAKRFMMYHVAAHSKNGLVCRICKFYFEDKESFLSHKTEFDHNDMLTCQECGKKFKSMHNRRQHSIVHKEANKVGVQCSQCGKVLKWGASLARHERKQHLDMNERKTFLCQNCGSRFTTKWALDLHVKCIHEGQSELQEKIKKYYKFQRLKRQGTAPAKEWNCEYCPKTFAKKNSYRTHVLSHPECKDIRCSFCPLVFDSAKEYRAHQEVEHRTFKCDVCKKGFAHKYLLKGHMNSHTVRYKCESCDRFFASMVHLKEHQRIHTGERPYCCELCGKSFKTSSKLNIHAKSMHTNKNYKCKICGKTFNYPCFLEAHMRTHTGERPFACLYCDKRYRDTVSRHKHVKRDHPENLEQFMEYKKNFQWEESKEVRINSVEV